MAEKMLSIFDAVFNEDSPETIVPKSAQKVLGNLKINEDGPGTILRDFETLLEFIGDEGLRTTSKFFLLPQAQLDRLNAVMTRPVAHRLKRPQQRSYPHLHGMHLILRSSGMVQQHGSPPHGRLVLEPDIVAAWRALNPTEGYFALLEGWLVQGSAEVIGENKGWSSECLQSLVGIAGKLRRRRTPCDDKFGVLYGTMQLATAALMELFGWVRLEYGEPAEGEGVRVTAIERLPLGDAMVSAFVAFHLTEHWSRNYHGESVEPGVLLPLLGPYFPEYKQALPQKEHAYREGTYNWRVSLHDAWRRIAAPADTMLDDLALEILSAFEFDNDHLYCFELRQTNGRTLRIACPYENDAAAFTDEVTLGELQIAEGDTMTMIFDYGDEWHFKIKLEQVAAPDDKFAGLKVIESRGTPPPQYDWDDEDDEDDDW